MKPQLLYSGLGSLLFFSVAIIYWIASQEEEIPADVRLDQALSLLEYEFEESPEDRKRRKKAVFLAKELQEIDFRVPGKPGYMYIQGVDAFRDAMERVDEPKPDLFLKAVSFLERVPLSRLSSLRKKAEVNYMTGVSHFFLKDYEKAESELRLAKAIVEDDRGYASFLLASIGLWNGKILTFEGRKGAIEHNADAIGIYQALYHEKTSLKDPVPELEKSIHKYRKLLDRLYLQKARIYLQLAQDQKKDSLFDLASQSHELSKNALRSLSYHIDGNGADSENESRESRENGEARLLWAQLLMSMGRYDDTGEPPNVITGAKTVIEQVSADRTLDEKSQRMAKYLLSRCLEEMGEEDKAILHYKDVAVDYEEEDEGIAANIHLARLLMTVDRDEEAIASFENALKYVKLYKNFENRWVTRAEAQKILDNAWKQWVEEREYDYAVGLSSLLYPLFSIRKTAEYKANVLQEKADQFKSDLFSKTASEQERLEKEYYFLWNQSGDAYANYAESLKRSTEYADALWVSVEHYNEARNVQRALEQVNKYIAAESRKELPRALLVRGKLLMDLGQYQKAISDFKKLQEEFPTDSGVYEARFLTGVAYRELDDLPKAEQVWRDILTSEELTPDAKEWRHSMYSLAELLFNSAVMHGYQGRSQINPPATEEARVEIINKSFREFEESAKYFSEYLERYRRSDSSEQARFYLAKALQYYAESPKRDLGNAETENAQRELIDKRKRLLESSKSHYRELMDSLVFRYEAEQLDDIELKIFTDSHFLYARTLFQLGESETDKQDKEKYYRDAIVAFNAASNRFSENPQVLLAYIQVAFCYQELGNMEEARGVLSQAGVIRDAFQEKSFSGSKGTNYTLGEWETWLDRIREAKGFAPANSGQVVTQ